MIKTIRKLKLHTHKSFGCHSRIVDGIHVKPEDAGGRSVGSKQIAPDDYPHDHRSRAEKRNAIQRKDDLLQQLESEEELT